MIPDKQFAQIFRTLLQDPMGTTGSPLTPPVVAALHEEVKKVILAGVMCESITVTDYEHPFSHMPVGAIPIPIGLDDLIKGTFLPNEALAARMAEVQCSFMDLYVYVRNIGFCEGLRPLLAMVTDAADRIVRRLTATRTAHAAKRARHTITHSQRNGKVPWTGNASQGDPNVITIAAGVHPTHGGRGTAANNWAHGLPETGQPGFWDTHWGPPKAEPDPTVIAEELDDSFQIEAEINLLRATVAELTTKITLVPETTASEEWSGHTGHYVDAYAVGVAQNVFPDGALNDHDRRTTVIGHLEVHPGWVKALNPPLVVKDSEGRPVMTAPSMNFRRDMEPALKELAVHLTVLKKAGYECPSSSEIPTRFPGTEGQELAYVASPILRPLELKPDGGDKIRTLTDRESTPHTTVVSKGAFSVEDADGKTLAAPRADNILRRVVNDTIMEPVGHALVEGARTSQHSDADGFAAYENDGDFVEGPDGWGRARDRDLASRTTWRRPLVGNIFAAVVQPANIQSNEPAATVAVIVKAAIQMLRDQRMIPCVLRYLDHGGDTGPPPVRGICHSA